VRRAAPARCELALTCGQFVGAALPTGTVLATRLRGPTLRGTNQRIAADFGPRRVGRSMPRARTNRQRDGPGMPA
jgi:hypothetical protein